MLAYQIHFLNPGHFHAALVLRESSARIDENIVVYGDDGPGISAFVDLVQAFNNRSESPTNWRIERRAGDVATLVDDAGSDGTDIVVLAGHNHLKLEQLATLIRAGLHVFADKPWLTASTQLDLLDLALAGPGLVMDIMTIRHEILSRLCHEIVHTDDVFGGFASSSPEQPAIELGSVHHLFKLVNGQALKRPVWYFDVRQQGDGMVDIQSHMVEQAMWFVADEAKVDIEQVSLVSARRWATPVNAELFAQVTGETTYPDVVKDDVDSQGVLQYSCNGEIVWSLDDVVIRQRAEWREREPEGAGDMHRVVLRGNAARVEVQQGPETGFKAEVSIVPAVGSDIDTLNDNTRRALPDWQRRFPGLELIRRNGSIRVDAPAELDLGHESHFPLVRDRFLDIIDSGAGDAAVRARIDTRYRLIAKARDLALQGKGS